MLVPRLVLKEIKNLRRGQICNGTKEGITSWKGPMTKCQDSSIILSPTGSTQAVPWPSLGPMAAISQHSLYTVVNSPFKRQTPPIHALSFPQFFWRGKHVFAPFFSASFFLYLTLRLRSPFISLKLPTYARSVCMEWLCLPLTRYGLSSTMVCTTGCEGPSHIKSYHLNF